MGWAGPQHRTQQAASPAKRAGDTLSNTVYYLFVITGLLLPCLRKEGKRKDFNHQRAGQNRGE